jgi:hypothetical protein
VLEGSFQAQFLKPMAIDNAKIQEKIGQLQIEEMELTLVDTHSELMRLTGGVISEY